MSELFYFGLSIAYTTLLGWWLMNHFQTIYQHQFDLSDKILRQLNRVPDSEDKDFLYGVEYSLGEEE